ncbi:MAG TPA: hypothetical protein DCG89_01080 [Spartobacteria bacterium]|nr:hypothetical protein [Spartobacteria bacterium]
MLSFFSIGFGGANGIFQNIWFVAAIWMGLALVASLFSIWTGISVALIEILLQREHCFFVHVYRFSHRVRTFLQSAVCFTCAGDLFAQRDDAVNGCARILRYLPFLPRDIQIH